MGPMSTTRIQVTPVEADLCCAGADCELLPATEADVLADVFKALADPTRVRLLRYLEGRKLRSFCPRAPPADMPLRSVFSNFNSTYLNRGQSRFFMQGTTYPYAVNTNYYVDWWTFHYGRLHDQWIEIK